MAITPQIGGHFVKIMPAELEDGVKLFTCEACYNNEQVTNITNHLIGA